MKLAGEANWWATPFLRRLQRRIEITEGTGVTGVIDGQPGRFPPREL